MGELGCGLVGRITPRADSDGCAEMPATDPPMYALHAEICGMQLLAAGDVCGNGRSVKCVGETMHRVGSCESAMRDEDPCVNRHSMVYMRCTTVRSTVKYSMKERPYSYVFVFCRAQAPRRTSLPVPPAVEVVRIAVQYKGGALLLVAAGRCWSLDQPNTTACGR